MSLDKCCGTSFNDLNESFYFKRDTREIWSKICGVTSVVCLIALAIFITLNLVANPNYSLFTDTITSSQISFVCFTLGAGVAFGIVSMILYSGYRTYDTLIKEHLFKNIKT